MAGDPVTFWAALGVGVAAAIAVVGANTYLMKLVIDNAVQKALLAIATSYVTKVDFDRHVEQCPYRNKA